MTDVMDGQMSIFDLGIWCGKTSPEHSAPQAEKTSSPSSKRQPKLPTRPPLSLDLRAGTNGQTQGAYWQMGGALLGAYTMHSFGESPNVAVESHLSQILQDRPHPKYCLSAKACQGILRRADNRGKALPEILRKALESQAGEKETEPAEEEDADAHSFTLKIRGGCEVDSRGKRAGKGALVQDDLSGTLGVTQDQTLFTRETAFGISSYESNAMKSPNPHSGVYEADTARTLDNAGGNPA